MNKKIAGMSVGAIVILAVVAFVLYWFAFRTEGFSTVTHVFFDVKNNGPGEITAQILGENNGQKAGRFNPAVIIRPGGTKRVNGRYNASDMLPFTLFVKSSVPHKYRVRILGAKVINMTSVTYNTLFINDGPLNQWKAWQNSRNKMPLSLRLPVPIYNLGSPSGDPYLKPGSNYVDFVDTTKFDNETDAGRRLFIDKL